MPTRSLFIGSTRRDNAIVCFRCRTQIHLNQEEYKGFREQWFLWRCTNPNCEQWLETAEPLPFDSKHWHNLIEMRPRG